MSDNQNPEDAQVAKIQAAVDSINLADSLAAPIRQAIDDVLQIAAETVGSADASVLIRDGRDGGLRFLVAVSELEEALLTHSLKTRGEAADGSELTQWLKTVDAAPEHRDLLLLGVGLRDIISRGEAEREMCRDILDTLARFTEKRSSSGSGYFNF